jgi:peptidoglycan/LPS O-acetylase OafA/YrhL
MGQGKLLGLQVARAFAALGIAYFHSWHVIQAFPADATWPVALLRDHAGGLAVPFFFAISGFVICMVTESPRFRPVNFIIRRAFRLYPLWIATSFVYLSLLPFLGRGPQQTDEFFNYSLTLLPTDGYPFYDIGWSLQHELAFYTLACIVVPLFGLRGLIVVMVLGIVADRSFALPWYLHQFSSYYPNFLVGIAAFLASKRTMQWGAILPIAAGFFVLYIVLGHTEYYLVALFFWVIGFVNMKLPSDWKVTRVGVLLGDASYSIYLIHPVVISWFYTRLQPPLPPEWSAEFWRYLALYLTCLIAVGSWLMFERPMIAIGDQVARLVVLFLQALQWAAVAAIRIWRRARPQPTTDTLAPGE